MAWETGAAGFWDRAVAGSRALQVALQRDVRHEVAAGSGICTGCVCWGMEKFYGTLTPAIVMQKAVENELPIRTLVLGMVIHQAARLL